ncbi:MAG: hypothetical protein QM796_18635 [Chthoniobacteraceae bacterium]
MSKKKYSLDELQERARQMTLATLKNYVIPHSYREKMVLGVSFEKDERIFELYVPGEKPSDAIVISRAVLNSITGQGTVEIIGLEQKFSD